MSVKIYNGMIAVDKNPFIVAQKIRAVIEPMFYDRFEEALAKVNLSESQVKTWVELFLPFSSKNLRYDPYREKINKTNPYDRERMLHGLIGALQEDKSHTFSDLDFGYDVVLMPNGKGPGALPLVLLFSERVGSEYRRALKGAGVLEEYGYWDNTDKPDEISGHEWGQRKRAWSQLDVPAHDGLTISHPDRLTTSYDLWLRRRERQTQDAQDAQE